MAGDPQAASRYVEDIHPNNHTSCWGSWWHDGSWGFACCHQTSRNSYCTGEQGLQASAAAAAQMLQNMEERQQRAEEARAAAAASAATGEAKERLRGVGANDAKGIWGTEVEGDIELDPEKLKEAIKVGWGVKVCNLRLRGGADFVFAGKHS